MEKLECEKINLKEEYELDISRQAEEIRLLKSKLSSLPCPQETEERLKNQLQDEFDEMHVELVIQNSEENELKVENLKQEYIVKLSEKDKTISSLNQELNESCREREKIKVDLESTKNLLNELQQQITIPSDQIEQLQRQIDSIRSNKEQSDNDHLSEVTALEKGKLH